MAITFRLLCVPTVVIIFAAFILSLVTSISFPIIGSIPIVRTTLGAGTLIANGATEVQEIRFGIWNACYYDQNEIRTCLSSKLTDPYNLIVVLTDSTSITVTVLQSSLRHGLAFKPVATASIFILLLFSLFRRELMVAIAAWISVAATILTLISLVLDSITVVFVRKGITNLLSETQTMPGIGLWLNVVTFCLILLATIMQFRLTYVINREDSEPKPVRRTTIVDEFKGK